jgi:hypothetical protein
VRRLAVIALLALPRVAAADAGDSARSVGEAVGYAVPAVAAAVTTIANGTALAYDASAPPFWRWAGWIAGGVEVAIGTTLLLTYNDDGQEIALGAVPVALGVASLATATFVDGDEGSAVRVVGWLAPGGGGAAIGGRF